MSRPHLGERLRRAWDVLHDDPGWLVVQNLDPIGYQVLEEFDTEDEAQAFMDRTPGLSARCGVMWEPDWRRLTLDLARDRRFWIRWGSLAALENRAREEAAERHVESFVLLADHNPLYSTGPIETPDPDAPPTQSIGNRLDRARRRADRLRLNESSVPEQRVKGDIVSGSWETGPHDDNQHG